MHVSCLVFHYYYCVENVGMGGGSTNVLGQVAEYTDAQDAMGGRVGDGHCRIICEGIDVSYEGDQRRDYEVVEIENDLFV